MRNLFKLLALGALYLPTAVLAAEPEQRFTHDGVTYRYTVTQAENGRKVIQGQNLWTGARFRFVVNGDRVEGVSGGQPVSFRTSRRGAVTLAAK